MKKLVTTLPLFAIILLATTLFVSCKKEKTPEPLASSAVTMLKAKTWIFDELIAYETGYPAEMLYKKGGANNQLDLSKVESKFLDNGVWQYINPFGVNSSGAWKLIDNNTKIEFRDPATNSPEIGEDFIVTSTAFSYKVVESNGYSIHKLIPKL